MPVSKSTRKKKLNKSNRLGRLRVDRKKELMSAVNESALQCYNLIARVEDLVQGMHDVANVTTIPKEVEDLWSVVSRDLQQMQTKLRAIDSERPTKLGSDESSNLMICMSLATQYEEWINEFVEVIVPNSGRLTAHLTHLVKDTKDSNKESDNDGSGVSDDTPPAEKE